MAAGEGLRLHLLGRFELRDGERTLIDGAWNRGRAKALIKMLALADGRELHREQLMDALWPGLDPRSAANQLDKNLHYIRTAVGDSGALLARSHRMVSLVPELWVDVDAFRRRARRARATRQPSDYEHALALYQGDLLSEDAYEPWTQRPREQLQSLRLQLLLESADIYVANRGWPLAEELVIQALELDPLHEEAHQLLIKVYASSGRREQAARHYRFLCEMLERDLGVAPSPRTTAAYRAALVASERPEAEAGEAGEYVVGVATASDGARIAYTTHGEGSPLVFVRGWTSNLDLLWQDDALRSYFETISAGHTLVRFDMRGNGLSQRDVPPVDLDAMVRDLEAVVDTLSLDRAVLYGSCFGGPAAIAYAARHPDRVRALILDGTYADGAALSTPEQQQRFLARFDRNPEAAMMLMTQLTHPQSRDTAYRRLDQTWRLLTGERARELYALSFQFDVKALLPAISAPTLVLHRTESRAIPAVHGRRLADGIPGARFVELPGAEHNTWEGDASVAVREVQEFLRRLSREASALRTQTSRSSPMASVEAFDEDQSADGAPGIQYARTCDGVQIAFAATGQGFPLVHMTQIPFNHLRMELEVPEWRRWHRRLGAGRTLVRYDGRGLGLSDRDALDVCTAAMVMDLEAVVQAAGLTSFDLFAGMNVAMAGIAFAAKHPDLVRRMVLWQPYARGSEWTSRSTVAAGFASVEQDWDYACDGAAASAVAWKHEALGRRVAEILKQSSSPPWVLAQRDGYYTEDVSDLLARVHVPTLIAYRPGCRCVSEDAVQRVAQGIPCASVMQLEGDAYLPFAGDVDAVVCAIRSFLDGPDAEADAPVLMNTAN